MIRNLRAVLCLLATGGANIVAEEFAPPTEATNAPVTAKPTASQASPGSADETARKWWGHGNLTVEISTTRLGLPAKDIADGLTRTILVGTVSKDREIPWTKPEDLLFHADLPPPGHPDSFTVGPFAFADGSVATPRIPINPADFRALLTYRGKESVDPAQVMISLLKTPAELSAKEELRVADGAQVKAIVTAMQRYEAQQKRFPPAVLVGPDGKPWHSWRVLLLPWLEQAELYQEYDFSFPWDHPKNDYVAQNMPRVYASPYDTPRSKTHTRYAVPTSHRASRQRNETSFPVPDDVVGSELVSRTVSAAGLPAKFYFEMPSNDGFAMRIVVEVAWNLNDDRPQEFYRIVVLIQRQLLQIVPRDNMSEMTSKQSHAKFIAELRDRIVALVEKEGVQINECHLQLGVMDDLSKRLREQVADEVILQK